MKGQRVNDGLLRPTCHLVSIGNHQPSGMNARRRKADGLQWRPDDGPAMVQFPCTVLILVKVQTNATRCSLWKGRVH